MLGSILWHYVLMLPEQRKPSLMTPDLIRGLFQQLLRWTSVTGKQSLVTHAQSHHALPLSVHAFFQPC
jgi:hypothetical protein